MTQPFVNQQEMRRAADMMSEWMAVNQAIIETSDDQNNIFRKYKIISEIKKRDDVELYIVQSAVNNLIYLLKAVNIKSSLAVDKVNNEIFILQTLKHSLVTKVAETLQSSNFIFIIFNLFSSSFIPKRLDKMDHLSRFETKFIISQLVSCLLYFSALGLALDKLKTKSIFVDEMNRVVLTNFTSVKYIPADEAADSASNLLNLGVIALKLMCDKEILQNISLENICNMIRSSNGSFSTFLEEEEYDFISYILQSDLHEKKKITELVDHKYLTSGVRIDEMFNIIYKHNGVDKVIIAERIDNNIDDMLDDLHDTNEALM